MTKGKTAPPKPLILIILDGWGERREKDGNALKIARLPLFDWLDKNAAKSILKASGCDVGLPANFQGNSEVGHLNLGAGRIVKQMMVRIDDSIKDRSFFKNPALMAAIKNCKANGSALHVMGLVQDQGVHAHTRHAKAILKLAMMHNLPRVWLHIFTDGRDTPPKSAKKYVRDLIQFANKIGHGKILPATLVGRYYSMDRDKRWNRTKKAYDLIVSGHGSLEKNPLSAISHAYSEGQSDEFITPRVFEEYAEEGGLKKGDSVTFFNFRPDRARQLTHALNDTASAFKPFKRQGLAGKDCTITQNSPADICFVAMTRYYNDLSANVAFENEKIKNNLGEVLSKHGLRQLRVAETEKYAHVTYFFNSEVEVPFPKEDRILIPSPRVSTYDLKPEMSAPKITKAVLNAVNKRKYDVIIVNFANADMVGHTGKMPAIIKAVQTIDHCVGKLIQSVSEKKGAIIITADHGNCEEKKGVSKTSHTLNPVPIYILFPDGKKRMLKPGRLADVVPTILNILRIKPPKEMSGIVLF